LKRTVLIEYVEVDAIMIHTDSGRRQQLSSRPTERVRSWWLGACRWCDRVKTEESSSVFTLNARQINK